MKKTLSLITLAGSLALVAVTVTAAPFRQPAASSPQDSQDQQNQQDHHGKHGQQDNRGRQQDQGRQDHQGRQNQDGQQGRHGWQGGQQDHRAAYADHGQQDHYGGGDHGGGYHGMHDRGRHEGWYRRGGRMPAEYRGRQYEVTDWRADHLRQPPRGYRWVRSDNGDFLLVAVTTGIIASILLAGH